MELLARTNPLCGEWKWTEIELDTLPKHPYATHKGVKQGTPGRGGVPDAGAVCILHRIPLRSFRKPCLHALASRSRRAFVASSHVTMKVCMYAYTDTDCSARMLARMHG